MIQTSAWQAKSRKDGRANIIARKSYNTNSQI